MPKEALQFAQRVPVLMYHRVGQADGDWERRYCVSPRLFAGHMSALDEAGWKPCALHDFHAWLDGALLPERSLLITFDDGFAGVYEHALAELAARQWPAVMFVVSGLVGGRDQWSATENPTGKTYALMDWSQLAELRRHRFEVGSHSRSHRDLTRLSDQDLASELSDARRELEDRLGTSITDLAYPYGRHDARVMRAAREAGYESAFSVRAGFNERSVDRLQIRRLDVYGTDAPSALLRKLALGSNDGTLRNLVRYYAAQAGRRIGLGATN